MTRGASARGRRTARRAAERSQQEGVNEALVLTAGSDLLEIVEQPVTEEAVLRSIHASEFSARERTRLALCAAGVVEANTAPTTNYELTNGTLAERRFLSEVIAAGFDESRRSAWPSDGTLGDHGEVLFSSDHEGVFRLEDGTLAHVVISSGWCQVRVASATRDAGIDTLAWFSSQYPPLYREQEDSGTVPITFWTNGRYGPTSRLRMIESASWSAIESNYTESVRGELATLMGDTFVPGKDGQLLLWQGSPGTGKTWALRALASEWSDWAEFNYITDPDAFFVSDPSYMIDVLLHESYETLSTDGDVVTDADPGGKWRVLILEDTGELLSANAKEAYGQGLSRLLNVVDGMVGQGLRILALVTTNDELGDLHPAAVRPGRCASQLEFGPLSEEESAVWLGEGAPMETPMTLAELYEYAGKGETGELAASDMPCADCGHDQMSHYGDDNMGACSMDGCSCAGFMRAAAEVEEAAVEDGYEIVPIIDYETQTAASGTEAGSTTTVTMTLRNFEVVAPAGNFTTSADLPAEMQPVEMIPVASDVITEPETSAVPTGALRWTAIFAPEGKPTDDGRIFAPGSITWRELPLTLMGMIVTEDGHNGAEVCGRIDAIWRDEASGLIRAAGEFDSGDYGAKIAGLVGEQTLRGVSVDIAVSEMEIAYRDEILSEDGAWIEQADDAEETEGPNMLDVMFGGEEAATIFVVRQGVIGAATVCPFPAFAEATIELAASLVASANPMVWTVTQQAGFVVTAVKPQEPLSELESAPDGDLDALTASAAGIAPEAPPAEWFEDPQFTELTGLMVDDDGRVYGHAASWDTCHIGIPGVCTTAPSSYSDYAYFHLKEVVCEDGSRISCGTITLDTGHADRELGRAATLAHYDDTGTATADVIAGEDDHGIWIAGALRADVDADRARKLRGSVLSGDWRDVNGALELVALLAVNVPGFPVPRTRALVASADGEPKVLALIAAGVHNGQTVARTPSHVTAADHATLAMLGEIVEVAAELEELAETARDA